MNVLYEFWNNGPLSLLHFWSKCFAIVLLTAIIATSVSMLVFVITNASEISFNFGF